jgi:tetratricopeptide (TPR) repeat protein
VVSIHTIDGMAGIGKTALALRAAHQLAPKFPDGQYFVELHAHTPGQSPADPADALARLLTDVGVDTHFLPETLEGRRDLWRDRTTGKKMLLILDDARDHAHVESLLPGAGGCLTLITSRRHLIALDGAIDLPLDVLEPGAAAELFTTLSQRTATTGSDQAAVNKIVRLCGYLPLAIVLLAGRLAHHRTWSIAHLADRFAAAQDRLDELEAGPRSVQAAFTMSYQDLPPEQQHMFRCLGLHPGADTDAHAAAALAGISVGSARRRLESLYTDHFVEEIHPGRYRLHDLLRAYARTQAGSDSPEHNLRAMDRLFDYYQATAAEADHFVAHRVQPAKQPLNRGEPVRQFDGATQSLDWLREERDNLLACLDHIAEHQPRRALTLTETLAGLFEHDGPWRQGAELHRRALAIAGRIADRISEANALSNLGIALEWGGDYAVPIELYQQALDIYRELGNRLGEANSYSNLGSVRRLTGSYAESIELHLRATALHHELGNRLGEANALMVFGLVRHETGAYAEAVGLYQQASALYLGLGNRSGEAYTLTNLGEAFERLGNYERSAEMHRQALTIFRELGYRSGEAYTLTSLGSVLGLSGEYGAAAESHEQALAIQRGAGDPSGEAYTLTKLGEIRRLTGEYAASAELHQQALTLSREIGHQRIQAEALNHMGKLLRETGEPQTALRNFATALQLARTIPLQLEQARALEGSALCRLELGDPATALPELREAVQLYRNIKAPDVEAAAAHLASLESPLS